MQMETLLREMIRYYQGDSHQVQHLVKVHCFARLIGVEEGLDARTLEILEAAAIVHDIGIKPAMEKHGSGTGRYQELEGPPVAREMLSRQGWPEDVVDRVCFLVGHHHTYSAIHGADYQILVEADFLVNIHEGCMDPEAVDGVEQNIFRTETGKDILRTMYPKK